MIIYLDGLLPNRSCDFGSERAVLLLHILHRVEFTATMCHHFVGCALATPFHPCPLLSPVGGISLLPFSAGHPGLMLSITLALWCSDFPHQYLARSSGWLYTNILALFFGVVKTVLNKFFCLFLNLLYGFFLYSWNITSWNFKLFCNLVLRFWNCSSNAITKIYNFFFAFV